eukprot:TRINITY_DN6781_c0_g1_i1.p1 TRINITY_DN6781_c0_g1~~TRINITY_DN6781_c0_g1_i1.p1  ORF type:complete len:302 (-),score=75.20 TRINITY_DN6781_c0_g1_i1:155-1060(-)
MKKASKPQTEEMKEVSAVEYVGSEESRLEKYKAVYKASKKFIKFDPVLIKKAFTALRKFADTNKESAKDLLGDEDNFIYVTITLSKVPLKFSPKPVQIPLKHPIYGSQYLTHACLFVKDPQRRFKDLVQDLEVPCLSKIIGYTKLLKNYKQYENRRQLVHEFDLFFCDKRIYRMLPKVTGAFFYRKKKFPYPLEIAESGEEIADVMKEMLKGTFMTLGNGPHYSFRVARTSMDEKAAVQNVVTGIYKALPYILKDELKPSKVQSITLKTDKSPELPIYCHLSKTDAMAYLHQAEKSKDESE